LWEIWSCDYSHIWFSSDIFKNISNPFSEILTYNVITDSSLIKQEALNNTKNHISYFINIQDPNKLLGFYSPLPEFKDKGMLCTPLRLPNNLTIAEFNNIVK